MRNKPKWESEFKPKQNSEKEETPNLTLLDNLGKKDSGKSSTLFENDQLKIKITQTERDSDDDDEDDLIAYDLSNDIPLAKTKQPAYLRDCLDGKILI